MHLPPNHLAVNQGNSLQYYISSQLWQLLLKTDSLTECTIEMFKRGSSWNASYPFVTKGLRFYKIRYWYSSVICWNFVQSVVSWGNTFCFVFFPPVVFNCNKALDFATRAVAAAKNRKPAKGAGEFSSSFVSSSSLKRRLRRTYKNTLRNCTFIK